MIQNCFGNEKPDVYRYNVKKGWLVSFASKSLDMCISWENIYSYTTCSFLPNTDIGNREWFILPIYHAGHWCHLSCHQNDVTLMCVGI